MPLNPSYLVAAFAVISESKDPEGLGLDEMAARVIDWRNAVSGRQVTGSRGANCAIKALKELEDLAFKPRGSFHLTWRGRKTLRLAHRLRRTSKFTGMKAYITALRTTLKNPLLLHYLSKSEHLASALGSRSLLRERLPFKNSMLANKLRQGEDFNAQKLAHLGSGLPFTDYSPDLEQPAIDSNGPSDPQQTINSLQQQLEEKDRQLKEAQQQVPKVLAAFQSMRTIADSWCRKLSADGE